MTLRPTGPALAALLAMLTPGAALAQDTINAEERVPSGATMVIETNEPPETMDDLLAELDGSGVAIPTGDIPEDATVETMSLDAIEGAGEGSLQVLDTALADARTQLDMLGTRIRGDEVLTGALEGSDATAEDVIGVYKSEDGVITLLIDTRD
ncbi:hypothetical protein [Salipiger mucosus]|uniref:Methionine sulfoxide reductase B n=1 Tax=Salipiger mucosus DSM 16094 TaxID=1123237 RepID=S9SKQ6_9RHOB|nr:hypothetical protein [Salipiger mucosus]EPX86959.1 methionine sulfoxide reductase B [Salipiger mucosus DSM 16094]